MVDEETRHEKCGIAWKEILIVVAKSDSCYKNLNGQLEYRYKDYIRSFKLMRMFKKIRTSNGFTQ